MQPGRYSIDTPLKKVLSVIIAALIIVSISLGISHVLNAQSESAIYNVVATCGEDESSMGFAWYLKLPSDNRTNNNKDYVLIAKKSDIVDGKFPVSVARIFYAETTATPSGRYSCKAIAKGLSPGVEYAYAIGRGTPESFDRIGYFKTGGGAGEPFSFVYTSDPQTASEKFGKAWKSTLKAALTHSPDSAFILNAGDQVDLPNNETQYDYFFVAQDELLKLPIMPLTGNHDRAASFGRHFNLPGNGSPVSGDSKSNYWFAYGDALFLAIDSMSEMNIQIDWMRKIVADNRRNWIILCMHEGLYSAGEYAEADSSFKLRDALNPVIYELNVDLVLQGHDHSYMRSHVMKNGVKQTGSIIDAYHSENPDGAVFMTLGSASGVKQYAAKGTSVTDAYAIVTASGVPTFCIVDVSPGELSIKSYKAANTEIFDYFVIKKTIEAGSDKNGENAKKDGASVGAGTGADAGANASAGAVNRTASVKGGDAAASDAASAKDGNATAGSKSDGQSQDAGKLRADAAEFTAYPRSIAAFIDNRALTFEAYNIEGYNYLKLRDIAAALNGTDKQFSVGWNASENAVIIKTDTPYEAAAATATATSASTAASSTTSSAASAASSTKNAASSSAASAASPADAQAQTQTVTRSRSRIYIDGAYIEFDAFNINGNNYLKLRDFALALDFAVHWIESEKTIIIKTTERY